jgi:hypothetical protein
LLTTFSARKLLLAGGGQTDCKLEETPAAAAIDPIRAFFFFNRLGHGDMV